MNASELIDEEGRIRSSNLTSGLGEAIMEDRERKLVDETKKRVVLTAQSYDEFRHLVASVHQKRLSRSDIESLQEEHKGWDHHTNVRRRVEKETDLGIHGETFEEEQQREENTKQLSSSLPSSYTSTLEFKRDWHRSVGRLQTIEEYEAGLHLLEGLGWKQSLKLFKKELDVDLLEGIMQCLFCHPSLTSNPHHDRDNETHDEEGVTNPIFLLSNAHMSLCVLLPPILTQCPRFSLHWSLAQTHVSPAQLQAFFSPSTTSNTSLCIDGLWLEKKGSRYLEKVLNISKETQPSFPSPQDKYAFITQQCIAHTIQQYT